jgi:hypothetical protein
LYLIYSIEIILCHIFPTILRVFLWHRIIVVIKFNGYKFYFAFVSIDVCEWETVGRGTSLLLAHGELN